MQFFVESLLDSFMKSNGQTFLRERSGGNALFSDERSVIDDAEGEPLREENSGEK